MDKIVNDKVLVRILQTNHEEVVDRAYYERYKNDGIVYLQDYKEPKVVTGKAKEV